MPLFVLTCLDKPGALDVRKGAREAHLAFLAERGVMKLGGPFLDEKGDMAGSLMIIEVTDIDAAREFSAADPYNKAGLFQSVDIRPFRVTVGQL